MLFDIFNLHQFFRIVLVWRISVFICISASQERVRLAGTSHPDWNNFVRWRSEQLGKTCQSPCPELIAKFRLWLKNLQEV